MTWRSGQHHGCQLLPSLVHLMRLVEKDVASLDTIAVAKGPGSYNGLRVGISTAKGLALGLGARIVAVSTLEIEAYPYAHVGLPVYPIQSAGRGEIAAACYNGGRRWDRLVEEHLTTMDILCSQVKGRAIFCGELSPAFVLQLQALMGDNAIIPGEAFSLRRASFLAELGNLRRERGEFENLASLQPLYLRKPAVTASTKWIDYIPMEGEANNAASSGARASQQGGFQ